MRVFLFGAGYSARAFARRMAGRIESIAGTTRSPENFQALETAGIEPLLFDGTILPEDVRERLTATTHLVVSAAPDRTGDPVLRLAENILRREMPKLRWIGYLSTVGVYGDHRGAWVDENSECRPLSQRSIGRLAAEQAWTTLSAEAGVPLAILRLSGIYGPGRNAFVNLRNGTARRIVKPGQVFNRIHVEDIAGALEHLAAQEAGGVFNITDDLPSPPQDVVAYAARLMGVEPPPEEPFETAAMTPMARSFYGELKQVSNGRIKQAGYAFRFPDYRTALDHMWATGTWPHEAAAG